MVKQAVCHEYRLRVAFGDTDSAGIVFSPNFYRWMDQATHELFDQIGIRSAELITKEKAGFPLVESHCRYFSPLKFHDYVRIRTKVEEVRTKGLKLTHEFYRGDDVIASGYEIRAWVCFHEGEIKAGPIPDTIREKLLGEEPS